MGNRSSDIRCLAFEFVIWSANQLDRATGSSLVQGVDGRKSLILDNVVICYHPLDDAGRFPRDDRYGRMIAICYAILPRQHKTGGTDRTIGTSLNAKMVEAGLALAYRPYSRLFVQYENLPRRIRAGMWRGDFQKPWDWRATRRILV